MIKYAETGLMSDGSSSENVPSKSSENSRNDERTDKEKKVQFSGSCSFMVSLLGYSMGTSDFWRFPYLVFRNGGGKFFLLID